MSFTIPERDLPAQLAHEQAVEAAYASEMAQVASNLQRGLPTLIECDKELAPFLFLNVRNRLRQSGLRCFYIDGRADGRPNPNEPARANPVDQPGGMQQTMMGMMIRQLRDVVRGSLEQRVAVLPHLDLLTSSQGGLTAEAREVILLLYENPSLVALGFKDPSFPLPKVIENLFPHRVSILGISRNRLGQLVTQREARKFGREFNPWALYKYVSGVNAVRLRRLLETVEGEDYPANPQHAHRQLRQATLQGTLEIPEVDLDKDIGGYKKVKERLRKEILEVLALKDRANTADEMARLEELIPRGMIFWGPPGTGKTFFAKAMAASLGAAITIVSGPELKSKWVGESEERLREVFHKARQSAPAIIVFDEMDSFASARGMYTGSGVEHSMVNQLLTEMDGFHREEMVFVVGTTNFVEALDPALLRPGRFEFHLYVPYPDADDRRDIIKIYDTKMRLQMTEEALDYGVRRTADYVEGAAAGTRYSGDHINALCRAIARFRIRDNRKDATTPADIDRGMTEYVERPKLTPKEERVIATHEAGHAVCSLFCPNSPPIERITIASDTSWALGYVRYKDDDSRRFWLTKGQMHDDLTVLMGGREAEQLLLEDVSTGALNDLQRATAMAHDLVEMFGMGGEPTGVRHYNSFQKRGRQENLSPAQLESLDRRVTQLLDEAQQRAAKILADNRTLLELLRDMLLKDKVLDAKGIAHLAPGKNEAKTLKADAEGTDLSASGAKQEVAPPGTLHEGGAKGE